MARGCRQHIKKWSSYGKFYYCEDCNKTYVKTINNMFCKNCNDFKDCSIEILSTDHNKYDNPQYNAWCDTCDTSYKNANIKTTEIWR